MAADSPEQPHQCAFETCQSDDYSEDDMHTVVVSSDGMTDLAVFHDDVYGGDVVTVCGPCWDEVLKQQRGFCEVCDRFMYGLGYFGSKTECMNCGDEDIIYDTANRKAPQIATHLLEIWLGVKIDSTKSAYHHERIMDRMRMRLGRNHAAGEMTYPVWLKWVTHFTQSHRVPFDELRERLWPLFEDPLETSRAIKRRVRAKRKRNEERAAAAAAATEIPASKKQN